jgi:hypothetical protein
MSAEVTRFSVQNRMTFVGVEIWVWNGFRRDRWFLSENSVALTFGAIVGNRFTFNRWVVGSNRRHQFWWASLSLVTKHLGQRLKNS